MTKGAYSPAKTVIGKTEEAKPKLIAPTNGLVAHYTFDGNAKDSSGNGNHGTENGSPKYVNGKIGKAINLDGVDDFVEIFNHNLPSKIKEEITVTLWRKSNNNALIHWGEACAGSNPAGYKGKTLYLAFEEQKGSFNLNTTQNQLLAMIVSSIDKGNFKHFAYSREEFTSSDYEHFTMVYNNYENRLYRNGELLSVNLIYHKGGSGSKTTFSPIQLGSIHKSRASIQIGAVRSYCGDYRLKYEHFLKGEVDDVRIYNRALNAQEIKALYGLGN